MLCKQDMESAGQLCVDYLIQNIREDGSFVYEQNSRTGFVSPNYNILRHSGAIYALCEWMQLYKNPKGLKAAEKALDYLKTRIISLQDDLLCVEEEGEIKLGGAALSLLALLEYHKLRPLPEHLPLMQGLAKFICWMQDGTGKFRSKFNWTGSIAVKCEPGKWDSTYYPGQAILALTRLYLCDGDLNWLVAAEHGASFLIKKYDREAPETRPYNHWLCIAVAMLYPILPNSYFRKQYWLLAGTVLASVRPQYKGSRSFSAAQMATRGEALVAGLLLEIRLGNYNTVKNLMPVLDGILQHCLSFQISQNTPYKRYSGGIVQGKNNYNIRIDYVQHTLSVINGMLSCAISLEAIPSVTSNAVPPASVPSVSHGPASTVTSTLA